MTNDGVTIAREINLTDPFENMGAQLVKQVATQTNDVAGDGATTATVLAQAMLHQGLRNVAAGANPLALRRGIQLGIIDPAMVTRAALENAASVLGLVLTTQCLIADKPADAPTVP